MKTRNLILTALTALTLSVLAGCSSETELPQEAPDVIPPGVARVEFAIKGVKIGTSYATAPTVALENNERTINDVTAYLFKLQGDAAVLDDNSVVTDVLPTTLGNNTGKGSFDLGKSTTEARYAVVFIANKACFSAALAAVNKTSNTTYADLNAIETLENTTIMEGLKTNKGLPMRALATITVPAGSGKVAMDAKFARPLSRFDIDNRAVHSFEVASVKLKNGRKTSLINVPGTVGKVTGTVSDIDYTSLLSDVNERLATPNADGSNTQLRPAFYVSPALSADNASIEVTGELRIGADYYPRTYAVPLISKDTKAPITLGINKRYRLTLLMDKDDNLVGEVAIDLGEWSDDGNPNPDILPDLDMQVNPTGITEGVTYTAATRTFDVPFGVASFKFEMFNDATLNITTDGTVVTAVKAVEIPISRGVNVITYQVTFGTPGKGHFTFVTEKGKQHRFEIAFSGDDPSKYPGTNLDPIEVGNLLWAPVNVGATNIGEPGKLFQYGRMTGWADGAATVASALQMRIPIAESASDAYREHYIVGDGGSGGTEWWNSGEQTDALVAAWMATSDGTNHACPKGWRLPTEAEANALLTGQTVTFGSPVDGVATATVRGVVMVWKEYVLGFGDAGIVYSDASYYWLAEALTYNSTKIMKGDGTGMSITGGEPQSAYYLRCVKDKPVTP